MHSNFSSCPPGNQLPELGPNLPSIPLNITVGYLPASNSTYGPMVSCCAPSPVQLGEGCYYWCKLNATDINGQHWSSCLSFLHAFNTTNGTSITGFHLASTGTSNVVTGVGRAILWSVVVSGLLYMVSA